MSSKPDRSQQNFLVHTRNALDPVFRPKSYLELVDDLLEEDAEGVALLAEVALRDDDATRVRIGVRGGRRRQRHAAADGTRTPPTHDALANTARGRDTALSDERTNTVLENRCADPMQTSSLT